MFDKLIDTLSANDPRWSVVNYLSKSAEEIGSPFVIDALIDRVPQLDYRIDEALHEQVFTRLASWRDLTDNDKKDIANALFDGLDKIASYLRSPTGFDPDTLVLMKEVATRYWYAYGTEIAHPLQNLLYTCHQSYRTEIHRKQAHQQQLPNKRDMKRTWLSVIKREVPKYLGAMQDAGPAFKLP